MRVTNLTGPIVAPVHQKERATLPIWVLALSLAGFIITVLVVYMFYARLRGIEDELTKSRIAYESAHDRESNAAL